MKRIIYTIAAAAVTALLLSGCIRKDAIVFHGVSDIDISLQGSPRIEAVVRVENTSRKNITLQQAAFNLTARDGSVIAKAVVEGDVFIPRRSTSSLNIPVRISIDNPLKGLALLGDIEKNSPLLMVTGSVRVKAGCIKKRVEVDGIPLSEFLQYIRDAEGAPIPMPSGRVQTERL